MLVFFVTGEYVFYSILIVITNYRQIVFLLPKSFVDYAVTNFLLINVFAHIFQVTCKPVIHIEFT